MIFCITNSLLDLKGVLQLGPDFKESAVVLCDGLNNRQFKYFLKIAFCCGMCLIHLKIMKNKVSKTVIFLKS